MTVTSNLRSRRRLALRFGAVVAATVMTAACAKPDSLEVGLKDYSTDVVYGSPSTTSPTTAPPPIASADLTPAFPSFIAPPPPPPTFTPFALAPPQPVFLDDPCPTAEPGSKAADPPTTFAGSPGKGVYPYGLTGEFKVGGAVKGKLPPLGERTITNVVNRPDGTFNYDVVVSQFGATTTSTYEFVKRSGDSTLDGLYLTRTVQKRADGGVEEFSPASPGLRILPTPIRTGTTFRSVATDAIRATSLTLEGTVGDIRQVDACGILVKGWSSNVLINIRRPGAPANAADVTITATYVIAPQLGGLFIADDVNLRGTDREMAVESTAVSALKSVSPIRAAK